MPFPQAPAGTRRILGGWRRSSWLWCCGRSLLLWARLCYSWQSSEGAGNGPLVITWISREHELYSGTSPISLVEHCVTFRHDRRLLSLLGFVHNWPNSRWSATKKENRFSLNRNGIMSSFLGRQCYCSTLYNIV